MKRLTLELRSIFEKNDIYSRLEVLNNKMLEANFWQDKNSSKNTIKEKKLFEDLINTHQVSIEKLSDLNDLNELALEEENQTVQKEILQNLSDLRILVKKNEIKCFLSNEADSLSSVLIATYRDAALPATRNGALCLLNRIDIYPLAVRL